MPTDLIDLAAPVEKAFLVAVDTGTDDGWTAEDSLAELANLATTAGADVVGAEWQNRRHVDPNWYVGKGKAEELVAAKRETGFDVLVADDELSPAQQRALEELLNVKVIDRSRLILDIFALHAQTHEGRLQVELAQLEYQLPRLTRLWTHLSRTGGGIGTRGPGESQLETDRRIIRTRISKMKERVEQVRQQRETAARGRDRRLWPTVGIVGYTNAGKSTLLNALVGSEVAQAEDKLFATLDPTSRQVKLGDGQTAIVTDTVGFIHKLPHQLVEAFRATLEEVNRADVLVEVVDASDAHFEEHRATVQTVLDELGAGDKPRLLAFNKADLLDPAARDGGRRRRPAIAGAVFVSALTGYGMETLRAEIAALLASLWVDVDVALPYAAGELLARVRERGTVELEYGERDVRVTGRVAPALAGELEAAAARWAAATLEDDAGRRSAPRDDRHRCAPGGRARAADGGRPSSGRSPRAGAAGAGARRSTLDGGAGPLGAARGVAGRPADLPRTGDPGRAADPPSRRRRRELHGNVVTSDGVRHLRFDWSLEHELFIVGSTVGGCRHRCIAWPASSRWGRGGGSRSLADRRRARARRPSAWRVTRTSAGGWHLVDVETRRGTDDASSTTTASRSLPGAGQLAARDRLIRAFVDGLWTTARNGAQLPAKLVDKSVARPQDASAIVGLARRGPRPKAVSRMQISGVDYGPAVPSGVSVSAAGTREPRPR